MKKGYEKWRSLRNNLQNLWKENQLNKESREFQKRKL